MSQKVKPKPQFLKARRMINKGQVLSCDSVTSVFDHNSILN